MISMDLSALFDKMSEVVRSTLEDYQSDFKKDIEFLTATSKVEPQKTKSFVWAVRDMGTHLFDCESDYDKERLFLVRSNYSLEYSRYKEYCINYIPEQGWFLKNNE